MDKYEQYETTANSIIDRVSEVIEENYPELTPKHITDDTSIENPALINGTTYYNLESEIARMIEKCNFPIRCPRDCALLELVDERMDWQHFKCPECGMKITCEESND